MEYHFTIKRRQYKDTNPLITPRNSPFPLHDQHKVLAEVEHVGTHEMYRGLFTVTSGSQIRISRYQRSIIEPWQESGWRLLGLYPSTAR